MQTTATIRIYPERPGDMLLLMRQFNAACQWLSQIALDEKLFHWLPLQRRAYRELRDRFGLTAAQAVVAIRKVAYAYRNGKRRNTAAGFRPLGGVPLFQHKYREGRVRFYGHEVDCRAREGAELPLKPAQGVLIYRSGKFIIQQPLEVETETEYEPKGFIGADLGVTNILADSDGEVYSSGHLNGLRHRHSKLRGRLQSKCTKSSKRRLKQRRQREGRFARDVNHVISKQVVAKAKRRTFGLALEDLKGIRERVKVRKAQRRQHHSWAFGQLRRFIEYKAALAGVPVTVVDPRNTSRTCPRCGLIDERNRRSQAEFRCIGCDFAGHADTVAAGNIARRALGDAPDAAASASCESPVSRG